MPEGSGNEGHLQRLRPKIAEKKRRISAWEALTGQVFQFTLPVPGDEEATLANEEKRNPGFSEI